MDVALLACVALNGYHSLTTYKWQSNEIDLDECSPLIYVTECGLYTCHLTTGKYIYKFDFTVIKGM